MNSLHVQATTTELVASVSGKFFQSRYILTDVRGGIFAQAGGAVSRASTARWVPRSALLLGWRNT